MYTPLHAAASSGQVSVVKLLLELGSQGWPGQRSRKHSTEYRTIDTILTSYRCTPRFMRQASSGQVSVVKLLLELGVEVDAVNVHGNTALHIACLNGQDVVVTELIGYGASINSINHRGMVSHGHGCVIVIVDKMTMEIRQFTSFAECDNSHNRISENNRKV